jgi:sigma-B regulation protein RsbQ
MKLNKQEVIKRNNVRVYGDGDQHMIFAHGFGCDQNAWRHVAHQFAENFKVVLFDYVGAGKSDLSAYDYQRYSSLKGYAHDVLEICDALEIREAIFVGHSVSCMVGAIASIREPSYFKHLVLIGPSPRYINDVNYTGGMEQKDLEALLEVMESNYLGWSAMLAPVIMGNPDKPDLAEDLTNSFCSTDPEIAKNFARVTFLSDNRKDLAKVPVKSLTLQCTDDLITPLLVGEYIQQNVPNNELVVLEATGHCPHLSAPAEVVSCIKSYINYN